MGFTILPPDFDDEYPPSQRSHDSSNSDASMSDASDEELASRPTKRLRLSSKSRHTQILVPGEVITSETQWMRGHGTYTSPDDPSQITASLAGPLTRTNKLLSANPLRARYTPSIGDLVVGRIVAVEKSRWKVDIAAPLLAQLALSSINLPGGLLRRRTGADELQMRRYLQEGDLIVAEVGEVNRDGGAGLNARSLKYGKLRDGCLVIVSGTGGLVRGRKQMISLGGHGGAAGEEGGGVVDVILGVNGYVWVSRAANEGETSQKLGKGAGGISISNLDDAVSGAIYSSQNSSMDARTKEDIAIVTECVRMLVDAGVRVDADTLARAYEAALDVGVDEMGEEETESRGKRLRDDRVRKDIVAAVLN